MINFIDGTIKASYANFGYIPYGHSIVSQNNQVLIFSRSAASTITQQIPRVVESCQSKNSRSTPMETSHRSI